VSEEAYPYPSDSFMLPNRKASYMLPVSE